jgi:hypothetical protein
MNKTRIKIFHDEEDNDVEQQINEWLETRASIKIIDVKFALTAHSFNAALVIYE